MTVMSKVRTRFAPSPTGRMHVGNLRTALYTYLIAKHEDGDFILRIEDTDQERFVEGALDIIYRTLKETGLVHDEGPDKDGGVGPYVQSAILISLKVHIFLQSLFQLRQLIIHTADAKRRREITDEAGRTAAFGLYALSRINYPIRINIGQITGTDIGIAFITHRYALTRKPFQTAMRTDMHHRICAPDIA